MNHAIKVSSLIKSYGNNVVLKGIDLCVQQGEIFALLGVNGAGKTTLLECVEGLRKYDSGNIVVNGKMGVQLQSASLPQHIKPFEAIRLFAKWNNTAPNKATLEVLNIQEFSKKQYYQLSVGQKRRLHLALAMTRNPDILFLDEPTAGLDVEGRLSLHEQIRHLKAIGKTIILASHDMAEVEELCDRIAILTGGKIAFVGTVEELNNTVGKQYNIIIKTDEGTEQYQSDNIGETLLSLLMDYKEIGKTVTGIHVDRGSLEQHFIRISKGA